MFTGSAGFFDELYSFRDFEREARRALDLARRSARTPIRSALDIGCATGDHAAAIERWGRCDVWGIDVDRQLLARARRKHSSVRFLAEDMMGARLGRTFDLVTSFYGVVAYARTRRRLAASAKNIARHLAPGGVAVVQPWHFRERYEAKPAARVVELGDVRIARASVSVVRGSEVEMRVAYVIARGPRVHVAEETHRVGLFSAREYREALEDAGLRVKWVADGPGAGGAFVGVKPLSRRGGEEALSRGRARR
jgi:SAM-dependent methyltransferase